MAREKVPTNPEVRKEWIKYQLRISGVTMSDLARQGNVTNQTVRRALDFKYPKWDRIIAETIKYPLSEIWPERYAA